MQNDPVAKGLSDRTKMVFEPMNRIFTEDLNQEKIQWVIENIDELFLDMDEDENDTY